MEILNSLNRKPWGIIGASILILVIMMAILAPLISPYGVNQIILDDRLQGPSLNHLLGADNLGRDNFTRLLWGAIPYVESGAIAIGAALLFSGFFRVLKRFTGRNINKIIRMTLIVLVIYSVIIFLWTDLVVHSEYFAVYTGLFVSLLFVPAMYAAPFWIIKTDLFSLLRRIFVCFLLAIGISLVIITPISFLGFGIHQPIPEWGSMLSGTGRQYVLQSLWMMLAPAISVNLTVGGLLLFAAATQKFWLPNFKQRPEDQQG